jgi:ribosomal protein S18 acetylase RimI-like enzyme
MPELTVDKLKPDQAVAARALYERLVAELYPSSAAQRVFLGQWSEDQLSADCLKPEAALFAAALPGMPVAGLLYGSAMEGGVGTILWLGVDEACRGNAVGRALLDATEAFYAGTGGHKIKLFCNTVPARRFYEHCGYQVEGFHPRHWWGMNCWSIGKVLAEN